MCGIFGMVTSKPRSAQVILNGLKELEYRGYDSWGVTALVDGKLQTRKEIGPIKINKLGFSKTTIGIGHTRWATHGGVTKKNAHPHLDENHTLAVVHNGILENWESLREKLVEWGHKLESDTDSEVIVHMAEQAMSGKPLSTDLWRRVWSKLSGLNSVVLLDSTSNSLFFGRRGSPLAIGKADGDWFIASDGLALCAVASEVCFLEDGWGGKLFSQDLSIIELDSGKQVRPKWQKLKNLVVEHLPMDGFAYQMLKEIHEQPLVISQAQNRLVSEIESAVKLIKQSEQIILTGCGTAHHAAMIGSQLFMCSNRIISHPLLSSEASRRMELVNNKTLVIALSQSGETIDLLEPVSLARENGAKVLALVNSPYSSLYRLADQSLLLHAGREKAVASTKAFMAKMVCLWQLSQSLAGENPIKHVPQIGQIAIKTIGDRRAQVLRARLVSKIKTKPSIFVLGKGIHAILAQETALKIKEISYIHAEAMPAGELKHGTLALIEPEVPCIFLLPEKDSPDYDDVLSSLQEVSARGGMTIGVSAQPHRLFDQYIKVHGTGWEYLVSQLIQMQLLSYELTIAKKLNPDKPRNLAKSVTVK